MSKTFNKVGIILIIGAVMVLSYCSSEFYIPSHQQISGAQNKWPEVDSTFLYKGYHLYKNKCGNCHFLYRPAKYTADQWNHQLPEMKKEAKLTDEEYNCIEKYLLTLSKEGTKNK